MNMAAPPVPRNEAARLRALRLYRILDTGSEKAFDDLTELAAAICDTPMSLITLIDESRQWFKSRVGVAVQETERDIAFCAHAILQDDLFVVEDATKDARFAQNPYVVDHTVRFYAGAPLTVADGIALGTLCVIDRKPRHLTKRQISALTVLRQAAVTQLELRRAMADISAIEQLLPMCAWCRSVRVADDRWTTLDEYVAGAVNVTHGVCPACAASLER
ncbi:MAG TPA: GAF domain-containing protein [Vicinamibacterales bacterium]|nr:GAF domain-containing protein [Vicinamibacterales bacterium]